MDKFKLTTSQYIYENCLPSRQSAIDLDPDHMEYEDVTETKTHAKLELGNLQIDNLVDEEMPVILGANRNFEKILKYDQELGHPLMDQFRGVQRSTKKLSDEE